MTKGLSFERQFCKWIAENKKMWVLRIPKNESGSQPFDIIAVGKDGQVLMIDCKECGNAKFPLSRIEENQWTSFGKAEKLTDAKIGIVCYYWKCCKMFFISYDILLKYKEEMKASIDITMEGIDVESGDF